jgi:branched-chain amino acid transport system substrate-binding protein
MLQKAMVAANSADPKAVALKLEGMTHQTPFGEVYMRASDHQIFQPFVVAVMADDTPIKLENSPFGFKTVGKSTAKETEVPTTCKMVRP